MMCWNKKNKKSYAPLLTSDREKWPSAYCDMMYYVLLPIIFTSGKMMQAAGANLFGVQKTFEKYNWHNQDIKVTLTTILMLANGFSTIANRGIKNFEYFLPPLIYFTNDQLCQATIKENFPRNLLRETYIIAPNKENKITLYKIENFGLKPYNNFDQQNQKKLESFNNDNNHLKQLIPHSQDLQEFNKIKAEHSASVEWALSIRVLYWCLYIPGFCTLIFSTIVAILASQTLADEFTLPDGANQFFVAYATLCNCVSYATFNLTTINTHIKSLCNDVQQGKFKENFNLPPLIFIGTIILTLLGMVANLGLAYFSMNSFFEMPWIKKNLPQAEKISLIVSMANVLCTLISGIFNLSANAYTVVNNSCNQNTTDDEKKIDYMAWFFSAVIFTDTSINCLGASLGIAQLIAFLPTNPDNHGLSIFLFILNIIMTTSYDYLTFGMMRCGAEKSIQYAAANAPNFFASKTYLSAPTDSTDDDLSTGQDDRGVSLQNSDLTTYKV